MLRKNDLEIKFTQIQIVPRGYRWRCCPDACPGPLEGDDVGRRTWTNGMNDSREIYRVSFKEQQKRHIGRLLGPETIFQPLSFLGLDGATPAQRGAWGALTAYVHGKEPGELIRPCWRWLDFRRNKKKHIINRSQNRTISIPSFPEIHIREAILLSHASKSCWETKQPPSPPTVRL